MAGYSLPVSRWFYQGAPAANGTVQVYQTGTTTPIAVYNDAALTSPAANPLVLDSNGECKFYVSAATALRLDARTSGGILIESLDPVYPVPILTGLTVTAAQINAAVNNSLTAFSSQGQCRLTLSGGNLLLSPYNGNSLLINNTLQAVPSGGVTLAATGLTPATLYYVYAYMNGATMMLEASATTHATSTATGAEIKSGDASRALVGMVYVDTGPAFADTPAKRWVISWFNRKIIGGRANFTTNVTTTSTSYVEIAAGIRCQFITWGDEAVTASFNGSGNQSAANPMLTALLLDSATNEDGSCYLSVGAGNTAGIALRDEKTLSEGYHYFSVSGHVITSGTATWLGGSAGATDISILQVTVRG